MLSAPIVCSTDFFLIHTTAAFLITVILSICHIFVSDKYTIPHNLELITCRVSIYRNMRLMQENTRKSIFQICHLKLNYFVLLFLMVYIVDSLAHHIIYNIYYIYYISA